MPEHQTSPTRKDLFQECASPGHQLEIPSLITRRCIVGWSASTRTMRPWTQTSTGSRQPQTNTKSKNKYKDENTNKNEYTNIEPEGHTYACVYILVCDSHQGCQIFQTALFKSLRVMIYPETPDAPSALLAIKQTTLLRM